MFISNASRMLQYYSAERQAGTSNVAHWYLHNVAWGRLTRQMPPAPQGHREWLEWHKSRKWPIVGFWEVACPLYFGADPDDRLPEGWSHLHPWFWSSLLIQNTAGSAPRSSAHVSRAEPY